MFSVPAGASAADYTDSLSFTATIIMNGEETEWEFRNPEEYELEVGDKVMKGKTAKEAVEKMFSLLGISETASVEDMVSTLKKRDYKEIERLDVRWINKNGKLFTWVWEK
ncbi:hypothetical protein [Bacillus marinisedimentorum]|uniref:hypothetical protein n=1 Tax=Bacillus marinisedimentorum TaxID=1821260 RepID=UPI0014716DA4|nr:hypothetical protein [Bacillus marinisedimentorum]